SWGERLTEEVHKYIGLEQGLKLGYNNLLLQPIGSSNYNEFKSRQSMIYGAGVLNLTPRDAKYRPFIMVGPGYMWYRPAAGIPGAQVKTTGVTALVYGIGMKVNSSRHYGVRFDLTGVRSGSPHFNLNGVPGPVGSYFLPAGPRHENSLTASVGVTFRFRYHEPPPPPAPAPPPPAPAPQANIRVTGVTGAESVCPGGNVRLTAAAEGWLPTQTPTYQWMVNGSPVAGGNGASFTVPTTTSGTQTVTVRVSVADPDSSATSNPVTVVVKPLTPPTVRFAVSPATVPYGSTIALNANATGSECGGPATVRYSGEGVTGSNFDSKAISFDMSNRLREQTRTVRLTATATDQKGQTASAPADVTVTLKSEARRLDDIIFPQMSARVNNCAKRVLLEQLTPMLRNDPQAKVILVGHRDESEKGRVGLKMDEARVVNAAAVLSAGTGICPQLDLSRIMWKAAGTDQSAETRPALCGSSTDVKERGGSSIKGADTRAQYRRVEIWIVPGGADMPAGVTGLQAVPEKDVNAKGCPK
ncbi:MAG: hypothetical protein JWN34_837, partial [Bryobacterales bacterium]|nr:hypothetical protein [Bryobacterales bacterium]